MATRSPVLLCRMRNDLRSQGKELDAEREESRTLRSKLNAKEQALTKLSAENTAMSERLLRSEGGQCRTLRAMPWGPSTAKTFTLGLGLHSV